MTGRLRSAIFGSSPLLEDPEGFARKLRAVVVVSLLKSGWRPPPLRDDQAHRLLDDMQLAATDRRYDSVLELTENERRILCLAAHGATVTEIATKTRRSSETIKSAEKAIREKLGARNTTNAVAIAIDEQLISSGTGWREAA